MQTSAFTFIVGAAVLLSGARACKFAERPVQVMVGNDALTVSVKGDGAKLECATTASALGMLAASVRATGKDSFECVLFEDEDVKCQRYFMETTALSLTDITDCDQAALKEINARAIDLKAAAADAEEFDVGGSKAHKLEGVAAVGSSTLSDLTMASEEECLAACGLWMVGCTHVTVGDHAEGEAYHCSFHSEPTVGYELPGSTLYLDIWPGTEMQSRSLGALSKELGSQDAVPPVSAPIAVPPVIAPVEVPAVADTPIIVPATAPLPATPIEAPTEAASPVTPVAAPVAEVPVAGAPVMAPEPAIPVEAPAVAPGEDAAAPVVAELEGELETMLYTPPGTCPKDAIEYVPAGKHEPELRPPDGAIETYADVVGANGKFPLPYDTVKNGGAYCVAPEGTAPTVTIGGTFLFEGKDGTCHPPPVTAAGNPCCTIYMWQPNANGFYYDNCSMKMPMPADGLYYFETEMPGDESIVGWGADPEPHVHYDVICTGCSAASEDIFDGGAYRWWSKYYPEGVCTLAACGAPGEVHQATNLGALNGQTVYKYDFVFPQFPI